MGGIAIRPAGLKTNGGWEDMKPCFMDLDVCCAWCCPCMLVKANLEAMSSPSSWPWKLAAVGQIVHYCAYVVHFAEWQGSGHLLPQIVIRLVNAVGLWCLYVALWHARKEMEDRLLLDREDTCPIFCCLIWCSCFMTAQEKRTLSRVGYPVEGVFEDQGGGGGGGGGGGKKKPSPASGGSGSSSDSDTPDSDYSDR